MSNPDILSVKNTGDEAGLKVTLNDGTAALVSFFGNLLTLARPNTCTANQH